MAKNKKCIQKGIYYSPSLHFYAFDIKTDLEMNEQINCNEKNAKQITWLFVEDVFDELLKEKSKIMESLNNIRRKTIKRFINALIQNFIREHMQCEAPKKMTAIEVPIIKNGEAKLSKS